jgi:hypothetical protein
MFIYNVANSTYLTSNIYNSMFIKFFWQLYNGFFLTINKIIKLNQFFILLMKEHKDTKIV